MVDRRRLEKEFYGTTTLGERGQVVIPAEARKALDLSKGDKLLVFCFGDDMVAFCKLSNLEKLASHLTQKLETLHEIIESNRKKKP